MHLTLRIFVPCHLSFPRHYINQVFHMICFPRKLQQWVLCNVRTGLFVCSDAITKTRLFVETAAVSSRQKPSAVDVSGHLSNLATPSLKRQGNMMW